MTSPSPTFYQFIYDDLEVIQPLNKIRIFCRKKTTQLNANFSICMTIKHLLIIPLFMFNSLL